MPGLAVSERLSALCPIDLETVPFWASLSSGFGWLCMTTPQYTFSCLIRSRFPDRFCSPVQQSRFFFPLSTRTYQAHAEGRGCLPFTWEAGVDAIPLAQYHLPAWICSYENRNDFRRSASTLAGSFERTGRTHRVHRTSAGVPPPFQGSGPKWRIRRLVALSAKSRLCR
jgi:hypothetical protein